MNKSPQHLLIPLAIFAAATGMGWMAGQARDHGEARPETRVAGATKPGRIERIRVRTGVPGEVLARLAAIRNAPTIDERLRATIQLAETLPLSELEAWWDGEWFDGREDMQALIFHHITRERWLAEDPEGLIGFCLHKDRKDLYDIARDWSRREPAAALAFLEKQEVPAEQMQLLGSMGEALAEVDPQFCLSRMPGLLKALGPSREYGLADMIGKLADAAPRLLKEHFEGWPAQSRKLAGESLAKAMMLQDFTAAQAQLAEMEDGKDYFISAASEDGKVMAKIAANPEGLPPGWFAAVAQKAPGEMVKEDPGKWLDIDLGAMGLEPGATANLRSAALQRLGEKDPERAGALLESGDCDGQERLKLLVGLAVGMGREKSREWLTGLTDPDEIAAVQQAFEYRSEGPGVKPLSPTSLLADLAGESTQFSYDQRLAIKKWSREQIDELTSGFKGLAPEGQAAVARKLAFSGSDAVPALVTAQALGYLLANPPSSPDQGPPGSADVGKATSKLAASWADEDPNAAGQWLTSLPAGQERLWGAKNLALRWAEYEPSAARRWIGTLPEVERKEVQAYLDGGAKAGD